MDVVPLRVLAQQIKTEIHEPQARSFSAAFLQLCEGKSNWNRGSNPSHSDVRYGLTNSWMMCSV